MSRTRHVLSAIVVLLVSAVATVGAEKLTSDELVQRHAAQVPGAAGRPVPNLDIRGTCRMTTTIMGAGSLEGPFTLTSSSDVSRFVVQFGSDVYQGESIRFDGGQVEVGFAQPRGSMRSALGTFLSVYRVIVREGLIGGVLNRRWPLPDLAAREAKVSYDGLKKLDGRELHRLRYRAKRDQGDLTIHLYFEPDTYRHVASVYSSSRAQSMGLTPESSSQQADQYFTLNERFEGFETKDGLTLPKTWLLRYARTGNTTTEWKYTFDVQSVNAGRFADLP